MMSAKRSRYEEEEDDVMEDRGASSANNSNSNSNSNSVAKKANRMPMLDAATKITPFVILQHDTYMAMEKSVEDAISPEEMVKSLDTMWEVRRYLEDGLSTHRPHVGDVLLAGDNDSLQMGTAKEEGQDTDKFVPFHELTGAGITHVATHATSNMVLNRFGELFSWGTSDKGVLGRSTDVARDPDVERKPLQVKGFYPSKRAVVPVDTANEDSSIVQVVMGGGHFLALGLSGALYVCGCYFDTENVMWREMPPPDFPDKDDTTSEQYAGAAPKGFREEARHLWQMPQLVTRVSAGNSMSAAVLLDQTLVTWGIDCVGELGQGNSPQICAIPKKYKEADTKEEKDKLLKQMKEIFLIPKPVIYDPPIQGQHEVIHVACGEYHMLVVARKVGTGVRETMVYSTGNNNYGQLGHGDTKNRNVLTLITDLQGKKIVKVAAGRFHSLFLDASGRCIFACGRSDDGQLGSTYDKVEHIPRVQQLAFDKNDDEVDLDFHSIAAGDTHSMAVSRTGNLFTWGFNLMGALGHCDRTDEFRPTKVTKKLSDQFVLEVCGGAQHTIVLATKDFEK